MRLSRVLLAIAVITTTAVGAAGQGAPRPTTLTGRVIDSTGKPIEGAEVSLPDILRRTMSNASGKFRFDSVTPGGWVTRVRKIGFTPQTLTVDSDTGEVVFRLIPSATSLAPVVTAAAQLGLSGIVKDASGKPVPGVRVRVLGSGLETMTDSAGTFWMAAPAGSHMVSAQKKAFAERLAGVTIPKDSGRNVTMWLRPAASVPKREAFNVEDLRERLAWGMRTSQTLFTRERLEKEEIEWIYDAVQLVWRRGGHISDINRNCMVLVNGGPAVAPLIGLTTDDVESVEIYTRFPDKMATVAAAAPRGPNGRGGEFVQPNNTYRVKQANAGKNCLAVYAWLR
jgi:hypothetical protein